MWNELICRFCGEIDKSVTPIFEKNNKYNLIEKIKKCIPLNISEDDQKPKLICQKCNDKITQFYNFLELCENNDLKYQSLLYENANKWFNKPVEREKETLIKSAVIESTTENFYLMEYRSENGKKTDEENKFNETTKDLVLTYNTSSDANLLEIPIYNYQFAETQNTYPNQISIDTESILEENVKKKDASQINIEADPILEERSTDCIPEGTGPEIPKSKPKTNNRQFLCEICKKTFTRRTNLNFHLAIHTNTRPFHCDKCDKKFVSKHELNIHMNIHTGSHECPHCSKRFSGKAKLERHIRIHTGEKPFKCNICSKAFSDKRNLSGHFAVHVDYRPFSCSNCDKTFRAKSHLLEHQRVHSMELPYICDSCGKRFKWKANLMMHLRTHTGEMYNCPSCPTKFTQMKLLKKHTSRYHQKMPT